jgi:SDR family mycofactocin-dependent oxidoreductase
MTGRLEGKVAFITGVARGQGRAHALRLAEEGADIIGVDICKQIDGVEYPMATPADLEETVKLVEDRGRRIVTDIADVRESLSLEAALHHGLDKFDRLDFVIANAGVMPIFGPRASEFASWQLCLDVLLTGVLNTVELTYPILVDQGQGGSIVITSSMAALKPMMRTEASHSYGLLGYSAAKAGLVNLARNYASILGAHGIRVNTIHPTVVNTLMVHNEVIDKHWETADLADATVLTSTMPVMEVEPEDVAGAVLWLCSEDSRYFTGNPVRIDAGANLR